MEQALSGSPKNLILASTVLFWFQLSSIQPCNLATSTWQTEWMLSSKVAICSFRSPGVHVHGLDGERRGSFSSSHVIAVKLHATPSATSLFGVNFRNVFLHSLLSIEPRCQGRPSRLGCIELQHGKLGREAFHTSAKLIIALLVLLVERTCGGLLCK